MDANRGVSDYAPLIRPTGLLNTLPTLIAIVALWISIAQGRQRQREYIKGRLNTMAADIAKIFGWLEGQRDQRISSRTAPNLPQ